jgi:hypothetical protein
MNSKEIEKVIRDAVRQSRCGYTPYGIVYQYDEKEILAAAINSLQEKEGEPIVIWGEPLRQSTHPQSVTICNELGDKPKSAQEETDHIGDPNEMINQDEVEYVIELGRAVQCGIVVKKELTIEVVGAVDGWGDAIDKKLITITRK